MANHGYGKILLGLGAWTALITGLRAQSLTHYTPWEKPKPKSRQQLSVGFLPVT